MAQQIRYYYASNTGKCRRTNQDNFYCNGHWMPAENQGTEGILSGTADIEKITVFGVFDGMGGEERGEMAAAIAAQQMQNAIRLQMILNA